MLAVVVLLGNLILLPPVRAQNGKEAPEEAERVSSKHRRRRSKVTRLCVRATVCSGLLLLLLVMGAVVVFGGIGGEIDGGKRLCL